jgi:hypothetical protein
MVISHGLETRPNTTYAVVGRKIGCSDYDEVFADFLTWPQPQPVSEFSILDGTRNLCSIQTAIASICTSAQVSLCTSLLLSAAFLMLLLMLPFGALPLQSNCERAAL